MKVSKDIQGMTASQSSYCEDTKGRELEAIRSEDCSSEANGIKGTSYIGRQCVHPQVQATMLYRNIQNLYRLILKLLALFVCLVG